MGDFSTLIDLPGMYRHCKATEDKDMTPFDFITDHLINIDGLFDKHNNGDEQKPHSPVPAQHHGQQTVSFITYFTFCSIPYYFTDENPPVESDNFLSSDYTSRIFRPPIV